MEENCYVAPVYKDMPSANQLENAQQLTLAISGMGCPNCATRVHNKLISLDGVFGVDVYLHMALAVVIFNKNKLSPSQLINAVSQVGTTADMSIVRN